MLKMTPTTGAGLPGAYVAQIRYKRFAAMVGKSKKPVLTPTEAVNHEQ